MFPATLPHAITVSRGSLFVYKVLNCFLYYNNIKIHNEHGHNTPSSVIELFASSYHLKLVGS